MSAAYYNGNRVWKKKLTGNIIYQNNNPRVENGFNNETVVFGVSLSEIENGIDLIELRNESVIVATGSYKISKRDIESGSAPQQWILASEYFPEANGYFMITKYDWPEISFQFDKSLRAGCAKIKAY